MEKYPVKLIPALKDYLWGGDKLKTEWGKRAEGSVIAESWELSCHADGESVVANGALTGKTLTEVIKAWGGAGTNAQAFPMFPVLVKLIDAKKDLSVQVHPGDDYALAHEGQFGKTEMWYIADAAPGAGIYYGFRKDSSEEELRRALAAGTVTELLNFVEVKPGEAYFIPSGTVHAICAGLTVCEIQQNSNVTYRVYDYGRLGADGKPRALHVEQALAVAGRSALNPKPVAGERAAQGGAELRKLAACKYFTAYEVICKERYEGLAGEDSFEALTVLSGCGTLDGLAVAKGDTVFVPAGYGAYTVTGTAKFLLTRV